MKKTILCLLALTFAAHTANAQLQDAKWIGTTRTFLYSDIIVLCNSTPKANRLMLRYYLAEMTRD